MPVKIKATAAYIFDNAMRKAGDVFDASEENAHTLVMIGQAEYLEAPNNYQHRAVPTGEQDKPTLRPGKNRYPRRDMRAEE